MIMKAFSELLDYYHHTATILMMIIIITWASTAMLFTISLATARFFTSTLSTVTFGDDYSCGYDDNDNGIGGTDSWYSGPNVYNNVDNDVCNDGDDDVDNDVYNDIYNGDNDEVCNSPPKGRKPSEMSSSLCLQSPLFKTGKI